MGRAVKFTVEFFYKLDLVGRPLGIDYFYFNVKKFDRFSGLYYY